MRFNGIIPYSRVNLGSVTLTGTNESLRAKEPNGITGALLQRYKESAVVSTNEVWIPVGVVCIITTTTTVTAATVQLLKNGTAPNGPSATAGLNGIATVPIAAAAVDELFLPFSDYTYLAAFAIGDAWSVKVVTTATAGVASFQLVYATVPVLSITDLTI